MHRTIAIVLGLIFTLPVGAAPVPVPRLTPEKAAEFDRIWIRAGGGNGNGAEEVRLVCRLLAEPKLATQFLEGKLQPLQLTPKEAKGFIGKLASEDEAVWQAAFRELRLRDVRLALTLPEAWELTVTALQRRRLAGATSYWGGRFGTPEQLAEDFERIYKTGDFTVEPPRGGDTAWMLLHHDGNGVSRNTCPINLAGWEKHNPHAFDRPRVECVLRTLEQIGSPSAKLLIEKMAGGNSDAHLTKVATAASTRMKTPSAAAPDTPMVSGLRMLRYWRQRTGTEVDPAELAMFLAHPEQAVAFLKSRLKPLRLSRKEGEAILEKLFSEDPKSWRAALRELRYFDIRLAMPMQEAWALAKTADDRCRLVLAQEIWDMEVGDDFEPEERSQFVDYEYRDWPVQLGRVRGWHTTELKRPNIPAEEFPKDFRLSGVNPLGNTLREFSSWRWDREKSALFILEAIGSEAALALIKEMADGNPDASPTQAAKEVLKRRNEGK